LRKIKLLTARNEFGVLQFIMWQRVTVAGLTSKTGKITRTHYRSNRFGSGRWATVRSVCAQVAQNLGMPRIHRDPQIAICATVPRHSPGPN